MKTIVILLMISFYNGNLGGKMEVWTDMESCLQAKELKLDKYDTQTYFACVPITKEELENPKGATT